MAFELNRRSSKQLKKFSNKYLDDTANIERIDNDSFRIWGKDPILGTTAAVGVDINQRGKISDLFFFSLGQDGNGDDDNLYIQVELGNLNKAFKRLNTIEPIETLAFYDMTNPQQVADAVNELVPGLAGGPLDVYAAFGENSAFS